MHQCWSLHLQFHWHASVNGPVPMEPPGICLEELGVWHNGVTEAVTVTRRVDMSTAVPSSVSLTQASEFWSKKSDTYFSLQSEYPHNECLSPMSHIFNHPWIGESLRKLCRREKVRTCVDLEPVRTVIAIGKRSWRSLERQWVLLGWISICSRSNSLNFNHFQAHLQYSFNIIVSNVLS